MKSELLTAVGLLCSEKGVPKELVIEALEAALVQAYKRNYDAPQEALAAEIDQDTSAVRIFHQPMVVEGEPEGPDELAVNDAREVKADAVPGDVLEIDVTPPNFNLGRIAAQTAKQVVVQKLREAERKMVYDEFADRKDEIVHGIVQRIEQGNVLVELGRAEALMPRSEQVPTERYYPQQRVRVYVSEVNDTQRGPQIIVSRAHRFMLRRLLEQEVPEIYNGTVEIKAIAREAGARSKVAVSARQAGIDAVGSCVGMRGVRIQNIVNELGGEKIDVVEWHDDPSRYVSNALSPAQVTEVLTNEEERTATVVVPERQLSLAIGKEGQNARLAAKLTGWRIDIKSDVALAAEQAALEEQDGVSAPDDGVGAEAESGEAVLSVAEPTAAGSPASEPTEAASAELEPTAQGSAEAEPAVASKTTARTKTAAKTRAPAKTKTSAARQTQAKAAVAPKTRARAAVAPKTTVEAPAETKTGAKAPAKTKTTAKAPATAKV